MHETTAPRRDGGGAASSAGWDRASRYDHIAIVPLAATRDPGSLELAAELAALSDRELAEQARLLAAAAAHPALVPLVVTRLRLLAAELARRLLEQGVRR